MMGVFFQALVPNLGKAKSTFNHTKNMLDFGSDFRLVAVSGTLCLAECDVPAAFPVGKVIEKQEKSIYVIK